jgi:hypothetical protein
MHRLLRLTVPALLLAGCNTLPPATPEQVAGIQGTYAGEAVLLDPNLPGPVCAPRIRMIDFQVTGNQVNFGVFSGTIRNNGSLEMYFRQDSIVGGFGPEGFVGELRVPPNQYCVYRVSLGRTS